MAGGSDRFDNNQGGRGSFVIGLLTGAGLGVGLGMLFAPKVGSELRNQLSEQAGTLANRAQEAYRKATENASQWAENGKKAAGKWAERGKKVVSRGADEAQEYVRDAAGTVTGATPAPATASSPSRDGASPTSYPSSEVGIPPV